MPPGIELGHEHSDVIALEDAGKGEQPQVDIDAGAFQDLKSSVPLGLYLFGGGNAQYTFIYIIAFIQYSWIRVKSAIWIS